jgi:hypothetical protein
MLTERSRYRAADKREMYAGGHPNARAKEIHRRFIAGPLPRFVPFAAVLETQGRISGAIIRVPLVTVRYGGNWYLVSMLGDGANWVRNVRAADGDAVLLHGRRRQVHLDEVPVAERAPIIKRYLFFAPGARPHMPVDWRAARSEFEAVAEDYPVFRLTWPGRRR